EFGVEPLMSRRDHAESASVGKPARGRGQLAAVVADMLEHVIIDDAVEAPPSLVEILNAPHPHLNPRVGIRLDSSRKLRIGLEAGPGADLVVEQHSSELTDSGSDLEHFARQIRPQKARAVAFPDARFGELVELVAAIPEALFFLPPRLP